MRDRKQQRAYRKLDKDLQRSAQNLLPVYQALARTIDRKILEAARLHMGESSKLLEDREKCQRVIDFLQTQIHED